MDPILVLFDIFPARVTYEDGSRVDKTRVIISEDALYVFRDDPNGPGVVADPAVMLLSFTGGPLRGIELQTKAGLIQVVRSSGCGCGSRVKYYQPFPDRQMLLQPRRTG